MATPSTPASARGPVLPRAFVAELIGATDESHGRFTEQLLAALAKISPRLLPRLIDHPFADHVIKGVEAFPALIEAATKSKNEVEQAAAIDAIAEVIDRHYATREVVVALNKVMSSSKSELVVSNAARALAIARDEGFLEQQRNFLGTEGLSQVRVSAKLLGYGKYERAVPVLLALIRPDNMAVADVAIWALGEIGSPEALPKLHRMLSDLIRTEDVIEAIGKIGDTTSAVRLFPILMEGTTAQREKAAHALVRILRKNNGSLLDASLEATASTALLRTIERDESKLARFYAIVGYSLLGGFLEPAKILAAVGGELSKKELDAVSGFFAAKKPPAGGPPEKGPPKKGKRKPV